MKKLRFDNGDTLEAIGLGTWKSPPNLVYRAVRDAITIGYRHIDCAWIYQNEAEIGLALKDAFAAGDVVREDLWVTSKLWNSFHAPEDVEPALRDSLQKLNLDYLDLYLMHWPIALKKAAIFAKQASDYIPLSELPIKDTWGAMEACQAKGLVRHIGVSNFNIPKLNELLSHAEVRPEMNQVELHPFLAQQELVDYCTEQNIHVTAYSPLASPDFPDLPSMMNLLSHPDVVQIANKHVVQPAQVVIQWAVARGTAVIPRSVNAERLRQNHAASDVPLSTDDMALLNALNQGRRVIDGSNWESSDGLYSKDAIWNR